ncbi:MAG: DUF3179 domain-containing (seleno)protein [Chloroflexota bacterium]
MAAEHLIAPGTGATLRNQLGFAFPEAPAVPQGPADEALVATIDGLFSSLQVGVDVDALQQIADSGDARAAWLLADLLRFLAPGSARDVSLAGYEQLTGTSLDADPVADRSPWQSMTDHLIAWDLPALPGYEVWKGQLFTLIEPLWQPFFADGDADIDWRLVSWGGVPMDARPFGDPNPCPAGCIPALDDPALTDAAGGDWYPDERLVFGVTVNGESRAYPKNIMEIHELVNDEVGGRRLAIPYCTLCGSAQAYFTDDVAEDIAMPVLRTSGLLSRSNKVMFDLNTFSVFDTFTGAAVSGPLREAGVELEQTSVVTSTWGDWKLAHPDTTIVAQDGGIGRRYDLDPLRGRDDNGAIFPIGDVDERLPTQEKVLGVITEDGAAIAFPVAAARSELDAGRPVVALGIVVVADASGVRATREDGSEVVGHEAFWFAWSQFNPDTVVWTAP